MYEKTVEIDFKKLGESKGGKAYLLEIVKHFQIHVARMQDFLSDEMKRVQLLTALFPDDEHEFLPDMAIMPEHLVLEFLPGRSDIAPRIFEYGCDERGLIDMLVRIIEPYSFFAAMTKTVGCTSGSSYAELRKLTRFETSRGNNLVLLSPQTQNVQSELRVKGDYKKCIIDESFAGIQAQEWGEYFVSNNNEVLSVYIAMNILELLCNSKSSVFPYNIGEHRTVFMNSEESFKNAILASPAFMACMSETFGASPGYVDYSFYPTNRNVKKLLPWMFDSTAQYISDSSLAVYTPGGISTLSSNEDSFTYIVHAVRSGNNYNALSIYLNKISKEVSIHDGILNIVAQQSIA